MSNPYRHKLSKAQFEQNYKEAMNIEIPALLAKIYDARETREKYKRLANFVYSDNNREDNSARSWAHFDADCGFWVAIKNTLEK